MTTNDVEPRRRVAVCLSGVVRNPDQNLSLVRRFLDGSGADVFFHFWDTPARERVLEALRPTAHVFEDQAASPPPARPVRREKFAPASRYVTIPPMFYSVSRALGLREAYEREHGFAYDVVVRLRLDFFSMRTLREVLAAAGGDPAEWEGAVFVPHGAHANGINDQMAFGTSAAMSAYAGVFDALAAHEGSDLFVAEYILLRHLLRSGLRIRTFPFEYVLLRGERVDTFDLERLVRATRDTWWSEPLPPIPQAMMTDYFRAVADSVSLVDELSLETPKVFRVRAGARGYLTYDAASGALGWTPEAGRAGLFFAIVRDDEDRRSVNLRPRELAMDPRADRRAVRAAGYRGPNLYVAPGGGVRVGGASDSDSAFLLARAAGGGVTLEWMPGFWTTPDGAPRAERRYLRARDAGAGGLAVEPFGAGGGAPEAFELEYVPDAAAEASDQGPQARNIERGVVRERLLGRALGFAHRMVRTWEERGGRVVLRQTAALVRRGRGARSGPR